jgi:hypothetical protein
VEEDSLAESLRVPQSYSRVFDGLHSAVEDFVESCGDEMLEVVERLSAYGKQA